MTKQTKAERVVHANALIEEVAKRGRMFFHHKASGRTANFEVTSGGRLRYRDEYTQKLIDTARAGRWQHFSGGGTLQRLVSDLTKYVSNGEPIAAAHFGPFPQFMCDGDVWGYGLETMADLRDALANSDCISRKKDIAA
ncbi:hypothetical protein OIU34_20030 [Pararhizobium sp. BT-229]|uniref:hypothetical protein n=1 Tax=Pararhizobium sp. BT-229 TaxID=2986923 RepID=UPI0021F76021|nr:hypothetical protein [Pararhizobium sp. BT-229]MCV9964176.1 hypothetical protein [Pararhizobium sp. BT-229]